MSANGEDWADASTRPTTPSLDTVMEVLLVESQPGGSTQQIQAGGCVADPLSAELRLKCRTQVSRLESLQALEEDLPSCAPNITLEELKEYSVQVNDLHQAFINEHAYLEGRWPAVLMEHEYFSSNTFSKESRCHSKLKLKLSRLRVELEMYLTSQASDQLNSSADLPAITVPSFNGHFKEWQEFKERFTQLVIKDAHLSDGNRLRYLRSSLKEAPAHIVEGLSDASLTFKAAWEWLVAQFHDRRSVIKQQLDKLQAEPSIISPSAEALRKLLTLTQKVKLTLTSMCKPDAQDCMLVHQVWCKLDTKTREAWETSLQSSPDYPDWESLEKFIINRARTLQKGEALPAPKARASVSAKQEVHKDHAQAHRSSDDTSYPCDCCGTTHFIVMCPKFRQMTIQARRKIITDKLLCRNCCGRHSTPNCKSQIRCKQCQAAHHTMLHLTAVPAQRPQPKPEGLGK